MELFTQIILVLAMVQLSLQAALAGRFLKVAAYGLAAALWALVIYPWIIEWPLTWLPQHLANPQWVGDATLVVTIEAAAAILIQIGASAEKPTKTRRLCRILNALPGVIFLYAVGYFESQYFGLRAGGRSFFLTALEYAVLSGALVIGLACLWRWLLNSNVHKRELRILLYMFILAFGLLTYAALFPMPASAPRAPMAWDALVALLAGAGLLFAGGRYEAVFAPLKRLFTKH